MWDADRISARIGRNGTVQVEVKQVQGRYREGGKAGRKKREGI
jgi:hypothetical protein